MRPTYNLSAYLKMKQVPRHNRDKQRRMPAKYIAILNACVSSHPAAPRSTSVTRDDAASCAASSGPVAAKIGKDDNGDGDGDPDSDSHNKRRSSRRSSISPALVQRPAPRRILRMPEVVAKVGLSKSTIYAKLQSDEFVSPVRLGARAIGFFESDIDAWLESRSLISVSA